MTAVTNTQRPLTHTNVIYPSPPEYYSRDQPIMNFTATGRPFNPSKSKHGSGLSSLAAAESMGSGHVDILPRRYNDDSSIMIPVLPPDAISKCCGKVHNPTSSPSAIVRMDSPIKYDVNTNPLTPTDSTMSSGFNFGDDSSSSSSAFKLWRSHRPSLSRSSRRRNSSTTTPTPAFVMKSVTRGEYLRHYAKDEQGRYVGTEAPASDCILRDARDCQRWRAGIENERGLVWKNEIDG